MREGRNAPTESFQHFRVQLTWKPRAFCGLDAADVYLSAGLYCIISIIESVDSISRDDPDVTYMLYITTTNITRKPYTFKTSNQRVQRVLQVILHLVGCCKASETSATHRTWRHQKTHFLHLLLLRCQA